MVVLIEVVLIEVKKTQKKIGLPEVKKFFEKIACFQILNSTKM
jgi:hypothetical protein